MEQQKEKLGITNADVRIGIGIAVCLIIVHFCDTIQALAACTAVIMCTQDTAKFTLKAGLTRLLGVVIGGVCASIVVLLNCVLTNDYIFILLCGLGVVLNLFCCKLAKMPNIVARVSCITFALVTLVTAGTFRFQYALLRLLGTLAGAVVVLVISWVWDKVSGKLVKQS